MVGIQSSGGTADLERDHIARFTIPVHITWLHLSIDRPDLIERLGRVGAVADSIADSRLLPTSSFHACFCHIGVVSRVKSTCAGNLTAGAEGWKLEAEATANGQSLR